MERYQNNIQDQFGNAIDGVTVTVRRVSDGGVASLFSDNGVTGKANPFSNDTDGEFFFYAPNDRYDIFLTGAVTDQKDDILLQDIPTSAGSSNVRIVTDTDAPAGPTGQVGSGTLDFYDLDESDRLGQLGFIGGTNGDMRLRNDVHSAHVQITASQAAGTEVFLVVGDPDLGVTIYYPGAGLVTRLTTLASGSVGIQSDGNTDAEARWLLLEHQDGTNRARLGYNANSTLQLTNLIDGAQVLLAANDTGSTQRTILVGDPDGESSLHNAGVKTLACTQDGEVTIFGDLSTNIDYRALYGAFADGTVTWYVGNENGSDLTLNNQIHGATTLISGEDTGGIERFFLVGDPDAVTEVRGDTDVQILVNVGAEIAVEAVANGKVGLRYDAVETFRTSDEQGADIGMGAEVMHDDQAFYPVGMNVAPEDDTLDTGNLILDLDTVGKMITYNTATARSLNFNNISDTKVGSLWALKVGPSGGTLTGDGGTGVQIRWWNGTGWTTTAAAGNITIGVGDYTIWKETDTLYHISGPTLS